MDQLQVMNFLNEVASQFPQAISLASGRPQSQFFDSDEWPKYQNLFTQHYAKQHNCDIETAKSLLCQYGPAAGIINGILQQHLHTDEGIDTQAKQIVVTNGCQEALALVSLHFLQQADECMLTLDPSYIGFSGLLAATGKKVEAVNVSEVSKTKDENGQMRFDWQYLEQKVNDLVAEGITPRAIYVNPDFNNPLAYRLNVAERKALIEVCAGLGLKIIEDNPYVRFDYSDEQMPSLFALDDKNVVYHIGSFSKTFCPGVRLGYLVAPEGCPQDLEKLIALKSLVSVNSSSLSQSVVGGFLLANDFSLKAHMRQVNESYQAQRDAMMQALSQHLSHIDQISFEIPQGGFFAVINLPFEMNEKDVFYCAEHFDVIGMPVSFFSLQPEHWQSKVRFAFSAYSGEMLELGVKRFAEYVEYRLQQ